MPPTASFRPLSSVQMQDCAWPDDQVAVPISRTMSNVADPLGIDNLARSMMSHRVSGAHSRGSAKDHLPGAIPTRRHPGTPSRGPHLLEAWH